MGEFSKIQWTTHTFNVWIGCTKVSEGCKFCYAEAWDHRMLGGEHWGPGAPRKQMSESYWNKPAKWNREAAGANERPRVFCSSLADVFDSEGLKDQRKRLWEVIKKTSNLDWLLLTKRPENIESMLPDDWGNGYPNVWMGTTTEDQKMANKRIDILGKIPAAVRFISVEPQLDEIDFSKWMEKDNPPFDWMIFGGESGSEARQFDPNWIKKAMKDAGKAGIARFVKQMGTKFASEAGFENKKGGDIDEWPEWLRVREFPKARVVA